MMGAVARMNSMIVMNLYHERSLEDGASREGFVSNEVFLTRPVTDGRSVLTL